MLKYADAMVGNSSSGIIESASFEIPVINIGNRQRGRVHSFNVINVKYNEEEIIQAVKKAISSSFKNKLKDMSNPYGNGEASSKIVDKLASITLNKKLIMKKFYQKQ